MRTYWFVIFASMIVFVLFTDYLYVNVGDTFIDENGKQFKVRKKNFLYSEIEGFLETRKVLNVTLATKYEKDQ